MIPSAVFSRYARSLVDVVFERSEETVVSEDLTAYRDIFRVAPELLEAFHSPAVPRDAKQRVLAEVMSRYPVSRTTANFLQLLLKHNRIRFFEQIFDLYTKVVNERKGIVAAQVTAAQPLSERDFASLRDKLASATGRAVTLVVNTDAELLGGLVVQIGSTVYDGSIRRQLVEMRERLRNA